MKYIMALNWPKIGLLKGNKLSLLHTDIKGGFKSHCFTMILEGENLKGHCFTLTIEG